MQLHKDNNYFDFLKFIFVPPQSLPGIMIFLLTGSFLLLLLYVGLLLHYRFAWSKIPFFTASFTSDASTFITVIIPARNEEENLPHLLKALAQQTYPKELFEVIVIDDHSTDATAAVVKQYSNYRLLTLKDFIPEGSINSYKKKAIEVGIQHSKGALIVTTDADCFTPKKWLETIASFYQKNKPALIVMPVAINCRNSAIEIFQALDFMTLQGITGAAVHQKQLSMCNGANLAYTRSAFEAVNGFKGIDNIASGDDMLLMHKIALQFPAGIAYIKSPEVIVKTEPVHNIKEFFNQRIRWASKADKYDDKRIFWVLLLVYLFNVMLLVLPVTGSFVNTEWSMFNAQWSIWEMWLLLVSMKTIAELMFLYPVATFFCKQSLLWLFPLAQPFHIVYTVIAGWLGKFGSYQWKDRTVK